MATIESNFESICINPNDDLVLYKKEIVRSRIEKFLYAICSLDTDDLPTPLSRIEELYNCLVTGEDIPTFTPLSRAEKFVMAMLGAYDVELLPTPISRSETLMKKIATGDNSLDDIDNLQSRYEFLLAYIIKAGGFNGGSGDFYYNLTSLTNSFTTIYDTIDMPVKNAVLRGQTLVNLVKKLTPENHGGNKEWGVQGSSNPTHTWNSNGSITTTSTTTGSMVLNYHNLTLFKPNTEYTLFISVGWNDVGVTPHLSKISTNDIPLNNGLNIVKFTTVSDLTVQNSILRLGYAGTVKVGCEYTFNNIIVLEGDWTNDGDIPYFEGMQSVKMPTLTTTGKNLFNINDVEEGGTNWSDGTDSTIGQLRIKRDKLIAVKPNTTYAFNKNNWTVISYYDKNEKSLGGYANSTNRVFTTPVNCYYLRFRNYNNYGSVEEAWEYLEDLQLVEEGSTASSFEPYKSTTVSCNEEVELRGIGDIKDELNLVTGEYTKAIYEYTFTGNESWEIGGGATGGYTYFQCKLNQLPINYKYTTDANIPIYCNRLPVITYNDFDNRLKNVGINLTYFFRLNFSDCDSNNGATIEDLKAYLKANPTTVQYPISKSVKTVDLSTLDQDSEKTKLRTFDDITHVTVSSEGLIPTGDIDIARPIQFVDYSLDNSEATLYNTLEYPVKSAVLKGNTLVNLGGTYNKTDAPTWYSVFATQQEVEQDNVYYAIINNTGDGLMRLRYKTSDSVIKAVNPMSCEKFIFTATESDYLRIKNSDTISNCNGTFLLLNYQEGMENWDIPYFEGMASVKMPVLTTTGKNLFYSTLESGDFNPSTGIPNNNSKSIVRTKEYNEISPNKTYLITVFNPPSPLSTFTVYQYDNDFNFIKRTDSNVLTTNANTKYVKFRFRQRDNSEFTEEELAELSCMITEGDTIPNTYEPYKSTTVTIDSDVLLTTEKDHFIVTENGSQIVLYNNEEVELRGIGEVKDELNLTTGELTQRIGEIVLDGSSDELWSITTNGSGFKRFVSAVTETYSNYSEITNWLPTANKSYWSLDENGFYIGTNGKPFIVFNTNDSRYNMSITEFENYLSQNPLIVQYSLIESVKKTVYLSTLDQDGKETELSTFDDITHVTVSSEGLVPTGEITVATKNATDVIDASVMSLRMDDILNSQGTLEGSANAQSDDIDVAMLGTTDIYEQLL